MDYYERKRRAQALVKGMKKKRAKTEAIIFSVVDAFQLSPKFVRDYLALLEDQKR